MIGFRYVADSVDFELFRVFIQVYCSANLDDLSGGIHSVDGALIIPKLCVDFPVRIRKHNIKIFRTFHVHLKLKAFNEAKTLHLV